MTITADKELLKECGRELAEGQIANAVESASDYNMMENQLFVLRYMALNILATMVYNDKKRRGDLEYPLAEELFSELRDEIMKVIYGEGETVLLKTKNKEGETILSKTKNAEK